MSDFYHESNSPSLLIKSKYYFKLYVKSQIFSFLCIHMSPWSTVRNDFFSELGGFLGVHFLCSIILRSGPQRKKFPTVATHTLNCFQRAVTV
jgi:hypothetical protein